MPKAAISPLSALEQRWLNDEKNRNWPLTWHLALRQVPMAMVELARRLGSGGTFADPFSPRGLARRAYMLGDPTGAYNLAMDYFNRNDLTQYRYWLRRAAKAGDPEASQQLRHFDTRRPHGMAPDIGRGRPYRADD